MNRQPQSRELSPFQRYSLAVLSVAAALGCALLMRSLEVRDVAIPLLLFAVAVSAWYGRAGARLRVSSRPAMGTEVEFRVPGRMAFEPSEA